VSVANTITDFHSHLIPGVDDGAPKPIDSAASLGRFRAEGCMQLITTPHFMGSLTHDPPKLQDRLDALDAGWEQLKLVVADDAEKYGSAIRVERGVEIMLDVPDPDLSDARLRLAGGQFVLVEYPQLRLPPMNAEFAVQALRQQGWIPVVAHPERYRNLDDFNLLLRFKQAGGLLQLNAGSIFGDYGKTALGHAMNILTYGLADYVCSDYHARGEPGLWKFARALGDAGYGEQAALLTSANPGRLLAGQMPLPVPPIAAPETQKARPVWSRLFGG